MFQINKNAIVTAAYSYIIPKCQGYIENVFNLESLGINVSYEGVYRDHIIKNVSKAK